MAMFPPEGVKEDSSKFEISYEDKAIKSETDGGYVYTRPRHGRKPRRTFKTGFTDISVAQRNLITNFINTYGTYLSFTYKVPDRDETVTVRFTSLPSEKYAGLGDNRRYNIDDIELTEV